MLSTRDKSVITAEDPALFAKSCHSLPCPLLCSASTRPSDVSIIQKRVGFALGEQSVHQSNKSRPQYIWEYFQIFELLFCRARIPMPETFKEIKFLPGLIPEIHEVRKRYQLFRFQNPHISSRCYIISDPSVKSSELKAIKKKLKTCRLLNWTIHCVTFAFQSALSFGSGNRTEVSWLCPEEQHINIFLFYGLHLAFTWSLGRY